jgi:hypothetical protein
MKLKLIIGVLFLCLIVFLFLLWPRQVNYDSEGIKYKQSDNSFAGNVSIKIDGQINKKYFGAREFQGRIYCDAIGLNGEYFNLLFDETNKSYLSVMKENGDTTEYGEIFSNKTMDELVVVKGDNILVFPAMTRDIAEATATKFFKAEYEYHFNDQ